MHETETENGEKKYISPDMMFDKSEREFNLTHLIAFGTQATCFIPKPRREGGKSPEQTKAFNDVMMGYTPDSRSYRIYDIQEKKMRDVAYTHTHSFLRGIFSSAAQGLLACAEEKNL